MDCVVIGVKLGECESIRSVGQELSELEFDTFSGRTMISRHIVDEPVRSEGGNTHESLLLIIEILLSAVIHQDQITLCA